MRPLLSTRSTPATLDIEYVVLLAETDSQMPGLELLGKDKASLMSFDCSNGERLMDNPFMKKTYFTLPFVYLYSLILAAADSFASRNSDQDPYNFETFCMRALVIFTYWLIVRLIAERAERLGRSYKATMIAAIILIPIVVSLFSLLLLWV